MIYLSKIAPKSPIFRRKDEIYRENEAQIKNIASIVPHFSWNSTDLP